MITFLVGDRQAVIRQASSNRLQRQLQQQTQQQMQVDITEKVREEFHSYIGNYINYLHGKDATVTSVSKLLKFFDIANYYEDDDYLYHLMNEMFANWDVLSDAYGLITDESVLWQVSSYLPFNFVAVRLQSNSDFIDYWLANLDNRQVIMVSSNSYFFNSNNGSKPAER